jgi:multiple sugar transport system substrate-binding protein
MKFAIRKGSRRAATLLLVSATASLALTACGEDEEPSDSGTEQLSAEEIAAEMEQPTELTWWTWLPDAEKEVAVFEEEYPEVDVSVVNVGQGADHYTKMRTVLRAGEGAPDLAQVEFQYVPSFTFTNDLLDLAPYGANDISDQFVDWTWEQVADGEQVYAIPQDTGPMGMLYRTDIFEQHGIQVPETWDEFAEAARELHAADPDVYMTNLAPADPGALVGLFWQAGSRPFTVESEDTLSINIDDEGARRVSDFWTPLIQEGVVSADPDFTDSWYQGLTSGRYATWLTAAWGPVFMEGVAAATAGMWRAAPLPQWSEGENVSGNWGGSTTAVMRTTDHPVQAAVFAQFINSNEESTQIMSTDQSLFPATKALLTDPQFTDAELPFFGGQQVNALFADVSETVATDFEWGPIQDFYYSSSNETYGKAMTEKADLSTALAEWQNAVVDYAEQQGFTVTTD